MRIVPSLLLACACLLSLVACGDGDGEAHGPDLSLPEGWPSAAERTMYPDHAPTPFTAAQIRAHCPSGLSIVQMAEYPGREPERSVTAFNNSDEHGTTWSYVAFGGNAGALRTSREELVSWAALQAQTSSPAAATVITEDSVTTPLGTFRCMLYTITEEIEKKRADTRMVNDPKGEDGKQTETVQEKLWYAYDLPGPPLLRQRFADDELLVAVTQVQRKQLEGGKAPAVGDGNDKPNK